MDVGRYERTGLLVDCRPRTLTRAPQFALRWLLGLSIGGTILALSLLVFVGWKPALAAYTLVLVTVYYSVRMAVGDAASKSVKGAAYGKQGLPETGRSGAGVARRRTGDRSRSRM